ASGLLVIHRAEAVVRVEVDLRSRHVPLRPLRRRRRRAGVGALRPSPAATPCATCTPTALACAPGGWGAGRAPRRTAASPACGLQRDVRVGGEVAAILNPAVHVAGALRLELEHEVRRLATLPDEVDRPRRLLARRFRRDRAVFHTPKPGIAVPAVQGLS